MNTAEEVIASLSGESKAMILLTEFKLGRLGPQGLQAMLKFLVTSDLERMGLIAMIQQNASRAEVDQQSASRLIAILSGEVDMAASAPTVARPLSQGLPPAPPQTPPAPTATPAPSGHPTFKVKLPPPKPKPVTSSQVIPAAAAAAQLKPAGNDNEPFYGGGNTVAIGRTSILRRMSKHKILLADDDARIRMVFRKRLEDKHYLVEEAENGQVAWEKLQSENFAGAILDMKMPGLHGLEILSRLAAAGSQMPVIICSAYSQLKDEFVIKTYPKVRFIAKPVPAEKLLAALDELIPQE